MLPKSKSKLSNAETVTATESSITMSNKEEGATQTKTRVPKKLFNTKKITQNSTESTTTKPPKALKSHTHHTQKQK